MPHVLALTNEPLKADLVARIPEQRALAISLCGNVARVDELVQETLVKAWSYLGSFVEGSNLGAWLFTILRNTYFSQYRKRKYEVSDSDGVFAGSLAVAEGQTAHMDVLSIRAALVRLPDDQREALILICAAGHSYQDAATICACAVGTVKSRVNRARRRLAELLSNSDLVWADLERSPAACQRWPVAFFEPIDFATVFACQSLLWQAFVRRR